MITQIGCNPFPGQRVFRDHRRSSVNLHFHLRDNVEIAVRMLDLNTGDWVAERIDLIPATEGCRTDLNGMFQALLILNRAGDEMQQLMRMHDVTDIRVFGDVADAVASCGVHVASA